MRLVLNGARGSMDGVRRDGWDREFPTAMYFGYVLSIGRTEGVTGLDDA